MIIEKLRCHRKALQYLHDESEGELKGYIGGFIRLLNTVLYEFEKCKQISSESERSK